MDYCVHIYFGDGKGKTTAAAGLAARALGNRQKVLFCQFLKNGFSGEMFSLKNLGAELMFVPGLQKFVWEMTEKEKSLYFIAQAQLFKNIRKKYQETHYDLVVLDEALDALSLGILTFEDIKELISNKNFECVLTGRSACGLEDLADYVTRMEAVKHPFEAGQKARKGVEY